MGSEKIHTDFAPAERASENEIRYQRTLFAGDLLTKQMLNAVPSMLLVLNPERQIVYANDSVFETLGVADKERKNVFGKRPGELLRCIHAFETKGGCGTTVFCSTCGAAKAILASQKNKSEIQECRIIQDKTGDALDLRVRANPLKMADVSFTVFAIMDISNEKRREFLERIFFHDILNTAGGLRGSAELIREVSLEELDEFKDIIVRLSNDLIEEIQAQRQLSAAESDELAAHPRAFDTVDILEEIADLYASHEVARGRDIHVQKDAWHGRLVSDRTLLRRVIGNMVKNALEASKPGDTITLGCASDNDEVSFWVHNPGFIPMDIQLQIFQRSFSTKGSGRGLGTYSIKLLTERYLKGRVSFATSPEEGTVFRATCPNLPLEKSIPGVNALVPEKQPQKLNILLAEDNPVNQKLMRRMIERLGHSVVVADNGKKVLAALAEDRFDLVLMDCQMPEMDGFETTRTIRKFPEAENFAVPIVAMTGYGGDESRQACLAAGMNDHIPKPVGKDVLAEVLARWSLKSK